MRIENRNISESSLQMSAIYFSIFRFAFGILMIPQVLSLIPHIHDLSNSVFVFHYRGLEFIEAYSHELIDYLAFFAILGAVLLALGILPRLGAFVFMICFGYLFLIDRSFYNNHYYLWCLLAFLFLFSEVHKSISIFDLFRKSVQKTIRKYNYQVFALMISIVYLYGGFVKLNEDWLQGYPMRLLTTTRGYAYPDLLGFLLSYGGLFFDLFIWILLLRCAKKWWLILIYVGFHISNYFIFNIGEFPLVMIAVWLIFVPLSNLSWKEIISIAELKKARLKYSLLILFFILQITIPLRSLLVPGNVAWHRQGYLFSWRMMLNNNDPTEFQFRVELKDLNDGYFVDFSKMITYRQFSHTYLDPYCIWVLAQKLKTDAEVKYESKDIRVYCRSIVKLNQHESKLLIDQKVDLTKVTYYPLKKNFFITDF